MKPQKELLTELGQSALEFLQAEEQEKESRDRYQDARNTFLRLVDPERTKRTRDFIDNPDFQAVTSVPYEAYQIARRKRYNAKRRLDTKFRQVKLGGVRHE